MGPSLDLLVLGPLEVRRDGRVLPVRRGRPRRLLLSLVLRRGGAVPPDTLIDQLWGDERPVNADNALQILVSYLRRALGGDQPTIERAASGYRLLVPAEDVDMVRFERLVRAAAADGDPVEQLQSATTALDLWRGPALAEAADDEFAQGDIVRLEELRLQAAEIRAAAQVALGRHDDALPDLRRLVREHPFRERLHAQLALALYRSGRQADALQALADVRSALVDELGLDLSGELQDLERAILRQDASLAAVPRSAPGPAVAEAGPAAEADPLPSAPPSPIAAAGSEVPVQLTPIIGRDDLVDTVSASLLRHRIVTLTGPGGTGKTRVGVEVAHGFDGTVWWADLSAAADRTGVVATVAAALGTGVASDEDAGAELRRRIGGRSALLVLDTCERVVTDVATVLRDLLPGCPGLRMLATSRRPIGVAGEVIVPVPPLALPEPDASEPADVEGSPAVRLFCERAAAVRPGFAVNAGNAAAVAAVCRLLDGLPLAVELAAGHAAALSPAKIAVLLRDRMRLLGSGTDGHGRPGGLRAAIDGSYDLLSADESTFLDRLSVFAGGFPLEAAVEVGGADLDTDGLQLLLSVVRQSLVSVEEADHFRLLDTIRAYAGERLARDPDALLAARDQHARWFAQFAQEADRNIRGVDQAGWLAELRGGGADLRAALRHCLAHGSGRAALGARLVTALSWFWSHEGSFAEAREWIALATAAGPHDPLITARLHLAAAMHAESGGDLRLAEAEAVAAVAAFTAIDDVRGEARSLLHLGTARWALGRLPEAAEAQDRAVALFRSAQHDSGAGLGLVLRARTALENGETALARELLLDARHVLRRVGDPHLVGLCLEQSARVDLVDGALDEAEALARQSLEIFESVGYREGVGAAMTDLGQVHLGRGRPASARASFLGATANALDLGHTAGVAEGLELLAEATAVGGDAARAAGLLGRAEALRSEGALPRTVLQERRLAAWRGGLVETLGAAYAHALAVGRRSAVPDLLAELVASEAASRAQ